MATQTKTSDRRWLALAALAVAQFMVFLDETVVNVALPSIKADLGFSEATLAWVVSVYIVVFGGLVLLGGRADEKARLAKISGKGMAGEAIPGAIERLVTRYLEVRRDENERFIDAFERVGAAPFEEALHGA